MRFLAPLTALVAVTPPPGPGRDPAPWLDLGHIEAATVRFDLALDDDEFARRHCPMEYNRVQSKIARLNNAHLNYPLDVYLRIERVDQCRRAVAAGRRGPETLRRAEELLWATPYGHELEVAHLRKMHDLYLIRLEEAVRTKRLSLRYGGRW